LKSRKTSPGLNEVPNKPTWKVRRKSDFDELELSVITTSISVMLLPTSSWVSRLALVSIVLDLLSLVQLVGDMIRTVTIQWEETIGVKYILT
jgi:hypothetical protein